MKKITGILIVVLMGVIILALTLIPLVKSVKLKRHGTSTESTVTQLIKHSSARSHTTYEVIVSFNTPDGNGVTAKAWKRSSANIGEKLIIYYDPSAPQKIDFGDSIGYNMRGAIVGGLVFLFGLYLLFSLIINESADKKLLRSGTKIDAEFVSVDRNEKYKMGDKNPWVIKCKWTDRTNNLEYFFVSKDFTINPGPYLNGRYHVDVYIDPANPGKYYMDTAFMPEGDNTLN